MRARKQRQRRRGLIAWTFASVVALASGPARADPTKEECVDANETAQVLRASGKLRDAQDKLALCASRSCPAPVRRDCTERLDEVQRALPTVVFAVRSARGDDMTAVRVTMDGAPWPVTLGGGANAVDPGPHTFGFEADGFTPLRREILVREAERERSITVLLEPAKEAGTASASRAGSFTSPQVEVPQPAHRAEDRGLPALRWIAVVTGAIGVVGVAAGGAVAIEAKSQFDAAEQETGAARHADSVRAVNAGNVATVVMSVGGLLAVGGVVLWLAAPSASTSVGAGAGQVLVKGSF